MKIDICDSYEEMSRKATDIIVDNLRQHRDLKLCAATGGTPTKMYEILADEYTNNPSLFSELRVIKLDEWGGIPMNHAGTCESYLQQHVIHPLEISDERYISFQSNPDNSGEECQRVQSLLERGGGIDICILGLGINGHIAFNEPADFLHAGCHVADLSEESLQHPMVSAEDEKPKYGLTLGMKNILNSKLIILLINGIKKKEITKALLSERITTQLPASFLWLHPDVICLIDKDAIDIA